MTGRKLFYVFGCIAIIFTIAYENGSAVQSEQQKQLGENQQNVDFKGKIVVLEITEGSGLNSESNSVVLANAQVLKLGNRDFIVGDALPLVEEENDWHKEVTVGIPCDNIMRLRTMTPERFKTYAKKWREQVEK